MCANRYVPTTLVTLKYADDTVAEISEEEKWNGTDFIVYKQKKVRK
jgi:hypothetical protein